jgi:molybdopterin molybdotransferase
MNKTIDNKPNCNDASEAAMTVDEAVQKILQPISPLPSFTQLNLRQCQNRILFEDIYSPFDVPGHNNSAMDGYALASRDLPAAGTKSFCVIGTAFAGKPFNGEIQAGECVRIMTGAIVPAQADAIVIQEEVNVIDKQTIEVGDGHRQHQNIRFCGEDIKQGSVVLPRGHQISAADLGVLASLGINELKVFRKPRVSFFSTGDELKSIGETLNKGEIYDSNRYSLFGLLTDCDVDLFDMGVVKDDPERLRETLLAAAASSDVVLTSGGVSVGEADYIKGILQQIGQMDFWKILMKPGRPLTFGTIDDALFFGLPGNPVAVMVTFYQFVLPALKKLQGIEAAPALKLQAISLNDIRKSPGRKEFQRGIASNNAAGELQVELTGRQGSGILTSMSEANCFIVLSEQSGSVSKGDLVQIELFKQF